MKRIPLSRGQFAIVDDSDFDWLSQWKWMARWDTKGKCFYAIRTAYSPRKYCIWMHRLILGLEFGDQRRGDHKNPSKTLDNRRRNLRIATHRQNCANRRRRSTNTSGYKGVSWYKPSRKWKARATVDGEEKHLGYFSNKLVAYDAYKAATVNSYGEFARVR